MLSNKLPKIHHLNENKAVTGDDKCVLSLSDLSLARQAAFSKIIYISDCM